MCLTNFFVKQVKYRFVLDITGVITLTAIMKTVLTWFAGAIWGIAVVILIVKTKDKTSNFQFLII